MIVVPDISQNCAISIESNVRSSSINVSERQNKDDTRHIFQHQKHTMENFVSGQRNHLETWDEKIKCNGCSK